MITKKCSITGISLLILHAVVAVVQVDDNENGRLFADLIINDHDLLQTIEIPFQDVKTLGFEQGSDQFPAYSIKPGSHIKQPLRLYLPEKLYSEFSIVAIVRSNTNESGFLFAILNPLETVIQLGVQLVTTNKESLIQFYYSDVKSELTDESEVIASFPIDNYVGKWIKFALRVTDQNVTLFLNCKENATISVKRKPLELVFDSSSILYVGQAGPNYRNQFEGAIEELKLYSGTQTASTQCATNLQDDVWSGSQSLDYSEDDEDDYESPSPIQISGDKGTSIPTIPPPPPCKCDCKPNCDCCKHSDKNVDLSYAKGDKGDKGDPGLRGEFVRGPPGPPGRAENLNSMEFETLRLNLSESLKLACTCNAQDIINSYLLTQIPQNGKSSYFKMEEYGSGGDLKGDRGERGMKGDKGDKGDIGIAGRDGLPGLRGPNGSPGFPGPQGLPGPPGPVEYGNVDDIIMNLRSSLVTEKGEKGNDGYPGPMGLQGAKGEPGIDGLPGLAGPKGDRGMLGETGLQGERGIDGIAGVKGDKGDPADLPDIVEFIERLPEGPQGPPGLKGEPGDTGLRGEKGDRGTVEVVQIKGEKGDRGIPGIPGQPAEEPFVRHIMQPGIPGPPGLPGAAGKPGQPGSPGLSIPGPKGEPGDSVTVSQKFGRSINDRIVPGSITFQDKNALLVASKSIALGTMAFIVEEEQLLIRVNNGWKYVPLGSFLSLIPKANSLYTLDSEVFSPVKEKLSMFVNSRHKPRDINGAKLRMAALNGVYKGNINGLRGADNLCYKQARTKRIRGTFRAFLSSKVQNLNSIVHEAHRNLPIVNLQNEMLFDSWNDLFSNNSVIRNNAPIYSFNGKNVLKDRRKNNIKAVWHGSFKDGERALNSSCKAWTSKDLDEYGIAGVLDNGSQLLDGTLFPCDAKLIILCIETVSSKFD